MQNLWELADCKSTSLYTGTQDRYVCYEHMFNFRLHQNYIMVFKHAQFNAMLLTPWHTGQIYSCFL